MDRILLALVVPALLAACSGRAAPSTRKPAAPPARAAARPAAAPSSTAYPRVLPSRPSVFTRKNVPLEGVVSSMQTSGKRGLLYFCADWCGFCFKLTQLTLSRPDVQRAILEGYVPVEYDVDTTLGRQLANRFGARGFPTLVVVDAQGQAVKSIVGFREGEALIEELR